MSQLSPFVAIRRDLHQIPELGFQEFKTQAYLLNYLNALPNDRLEIENWRTGIFVKILGEIHGKQLGIEQILMDCRLKNKRDFPLPRIMKRICMLVVMIFI